jgi:hypothetical protein
VHEDVEHAPAPIDLRERLDDRRGVGEVRGHAHGVAAAGAPQRVDGLVHRGPAARHDGDPCSLTGEDFGHGTAHALRAAGHHGGGAGKTKIHLYSAPQGG